MKLFDYMYSNIISLFLTKGTIWNIICMHLFKIYLFKFTKYCRLHSDILCSKLYHPFKRLWLLKALLIMKNMFDERGEYNTSSLCFQMWYTQYMCLEKVYEMLGMMQVCVQWEKWEKWPEAYTEACLLWLKYIYITFYSYAFLSFFKLLKHVMSSNYLVLLHILPSVC